MLVRLVQGIHAGKKGLRDEPPVGSHQPHMAIYIYCLSFAFYLIISTIHQEGVPSERSPIQKADSLGKKRNRKVFIKLERR